MSKLEYGYEVVFQDETDVSEVVSRVTEALNAEGFGILTEIDVRKTLDAKLGVEFRDYKILGACNPTLAHKAIQAEPDIGLLLPCNVVVQGAEQGFLVSIAAPKAMFAMVDNDALRDVMEEADARLRRAAEAMG